MKERLKMARPTAADYKTLLNPDAGKHKPKYWLGEVTKCDVCGGDFGRSMHDASVRGHWANVCDACFSDEGCSTGTGHGQSYRKQADGRWLKVAG
jgi:hypothetical protein